jgi:hypothetical protein
MTETSQISGPLAEFLADRIPRAAKKAHRRFPQVPCEDFEQAMWLRVYVNPPKFCKLWAEDRKGIIWTELQRAGVKAGMSDDRWRRAERARLAGYGKVDEEFYGSPALGLLLEILVSAEFDVPSVMERTLGGTDSAGVHISNPDGRASEDYLAALIDAKAAFRRLSPGSQRLLTAYYGTNQEDTSAGRWDREKLASSMGLTSEALRQRAHRAVIQLQRELGGENPWRK